MISSLLIRIPNRDVTNVTELENIDTDNQDIAKSNITNVTPNEPDLKESYYDKAETDFT